MNSEQRQLWQKINDFEFDKANSQYSFSQRLARENSWSLDYSDRVITEYRKFTFLAINAGHVVTPIYGLWATLKFRAKVTHGSYSGCGGGG